MEGILIIILSLGRCLIFNCVVSLLRWLWMVCSLLILLIIGSSIW